MLAAALDDATILSPAAAGANRALDAIESRSASDLRQAITAFRQRHSVGAFISFSEKVGMPLALLLAAHHDRTPHVLIAHHLTSPRKRALQDRTRWLRRFTRIVVVAQPQADYLRDEVRLPEDAFLFVPDAVDTVFWRTPGDTPPAANACILSVGRERRDYDTLLAAARQMPDVPFTIVADSLWSRQRPFGLPLSRSVGSPKAKLSDRGGGGGEGRRGEGNPVPPNVTVRSGLSFPELRTLYASATVVVVPLEADTRYAAGANGLLEGMAMRQPVILTQTPGLAGYASRGEVDRVPAGDPAAIAAAVLGLLADPASASRHGAAARAEVEARHTMEAYVGVLEQIVRAALAPAAGAGSAS
jgi:glycosyltransferase involved in cell wall biosynthesis